MNESIQKSKRSLKREAKRENKRYKQNQKEEARTVEKEISACILTNQNMFTNYTVTNYLKQINSTLFSFIKQEYSDLEPIEMQINLGIIHNKLKPFIKYNVEMYKLKYKFEGKGKEKHLSVYRTKRVSFSQNQLSLLNSNPEALSGQIFEKVLSHFAPKPNFHNMFNQMPNGHIVGSHCKPISKDNIGYSLFQKLGWNEEDPMGPIIEATLRLKKLGLGYTL